MALATLASAYLYMGCVASVVVTLLELVRQRPAPRVLNRLFPLSQKILLFVEGPPMKAMYLRVRSVPDGPWINVPANLRLRGVDWLVGLRFVATYHFVPSLYRAVEALRASHKRAREDATEWLQEAAHRAAGLDSSAFEVEVVSQSSLRSPEVRRLFRLTFAAGSRP